METYQVGKVAYGTVTGIENYGIFLTFENGYTGLIHISQLSEHFVKNVGDYARLGEESYIEHGFSPLKKQLPIWIEEKLKELK